MILNMCLKYVKLKVRLLKLGVLGNVLIYSLSAHTPTYRTEKVSGIREFCVRSAQSLSGAGEQP